MPPSGCEDLPEDVALPPTKRARVLQEKKAQAPRKRKERAKNVEDAITAANNEIENGPPEKKRRRADPTAVRYVVTAYHMFHIPFSLSFVVAYSFFFACSRRRPGKENENGVEPSKPARKPAKKALDKVQYHIVPPFQYAPILS